MSNLLLPIYFLIDTSDSMNVGDKIGLVNQAINKMLRICRERQATRDITLVSIITFNSEASLLMPMTELKKCNPTRFKATNNTSLGAAFDLFKSRLEIDNSTYGKYSREPIAFLLTDGYPTDEYSNPLARLKASSVSFRSVAIGFGSDVDFNVLGEFSSDVYQMESMTDNDFGNLFGWIGQIIEQGASALPQLGANLVQLKAKEIFALKGKPRAAQLPSRELLMLPPPPSNLKKK